MALGTSINVIGTPAKTFSAVVPMSIASAWVTVIDAGGMDAADAATITNPTTQITASDHHIFKRNAIGTTMIVRLVYDDGLTAIVSPVIKVFGRSDSSQVWQLIKTKTGALSATITTATTTDVTDGTNLYTTPDLDTQSWDCYGCGEILIGVETALSGVGTVSTAYLQAKMV